MFRPLGDTGGRVGREKWVCPTLCTGGQHIHLGPQRRGIPIGPGEISQVSTG